MKLYELANQILEAERLQKEAEEQQERERQTAKDNELCGEFETAFADYLPMIQEAGISYRAVNEFQAQYIEFRKGEKSTTFQFSSTTSWRFNPSAVYGTWDKDGLVLLLAKAFPLTDSANA